MISILSETSKPTDIKTLIPDIYALFNSSKGRTISEENLQSFLQNIEGVIRKRFNTEITSTEEPPKPSQETPYPGLRMSKLGVPNRKLFYELCGEKVEGLEVKEETVSPENHIKFIYGDILEQLVLFMAKEAGHNVQDEQEEVVLDGVVGHIDAVIDGVVTDVKSTSSFAFPKFVTGSLLNDEGKDPFGYRAQLSSYMYAKGNSKGAFLAINKENGALALLELSPIDTINPPERIKEIKSILDNDKPPEEKCYEDEFFGKSGNKVLSKNCSYCHFKDHCWKDSNSGKGLRRFQYSDGVREFTQIVETPRVQERE